MPQAYINYYKKSLEILSKLPKEGKKPSLCFHVCCGPCSTFPLTFLCPHFEVTIFFNNSNIFPLEEYQRRLDELKRFLILFEKDYGYHVNLIVTPYDNAGYIEELLPYKDEEEGRTRCHICYRKRMMEAYDYAERNGFDYFCTVMSISRQKDSQVLNKIGEELEKLHPHTKYFYSDFKKNKGIDIAREMRLRYDLYNQTYCGCQFSLHKRQQKETDKNQNWKG